VSGAGDSVGGIKRRVRKKSWFGLAVPPLVVALANPGTATALMAPKK
jgi:hypothetical protein